MEIGETKRETGSEPDTRERLRASTHRLQGSL